MLKKLFHYLTGKPVPLKDNEWPYLQTEEAKNRYRMAADRVVGCKNIVEIGGYTTPIYEFLVGDHEEIWMIDPKVEARDFTLKVKTKFAKVKIVKSFFHSIDLNFPSKSYGLLLIGCSLKFKKGDEEDEAAVWRKLKVWSGNAERVVLEYATFWENANKARATIESNSNLQLLEELQITIPVSAEDDSRFGQRTFLVYGQRT